MAAFIMRRVLFALLTIWALSVISYIVIQLPPGDFVDTYIQELMFGAGGYELGARYRRASKRHCGRNMA